MPTRTDLTTYLEHFRARVLQDALNEATAAYWLRRAAAFDNARSRPGDFPGTHTTPEARHTHDKALDDLAAACRAHASLAPLQTAPEPAIWAALAAAA